VLTLSLSLTEFSSNQCFHCYMVGGAITHLLIQNLLIKKHRQKNEAETRDKSIGYACCSL